MSSPPDKPSDIEITEVLAYSLFHLSCIKDRSEKAPPVSSSPNTWRTNVAIRKAYRADARHLQGVLAQFMVSPKSSSSAGTRKALDGLVTVPAAPAYVLGADEGITIKEP